MLMPMESVSVSDVCFDLPYLATAPPPDNGAEPLVSAGPFHGSCSDSHGLSAASSAVTFSMSRKEG